MIRVPFVQEVVPLGPTVTLEFHNNFTVALSSFTRVFANEAPVFEFSMLKTAGSVEHYKQIQIYKCKFEGNRGY